MGTGRPDASEHLPPDASPASREGSGLTGIVGGVLDRRRLRSPRRWPGPYLDLTPSETVDPAGVRMLVGGRTVRLSQLVVPSRLPAAVRRLRAVHRAGRAARERVGLDVVRMVLGTVTWDEPEGPDQHGASTGPVLPVLVAGVDVTMRAGDDADLVVRVPWGLPSVVLGELAAVGVEIDPAQILATEGGVRAVLERIGEAGRDVPGLRVNQRVLLGALPFLGRSAVDDPVSVTDRRPRSDDGAEGGGARSHADRHDGDVGGHGGRSDHDDQDDQDDHVALVLPADAEQRALLRVVVDDQLHDDGHDVHDVLVDAPAGTGTCDTVVNLAAALAARGRSVLVVGEEAASLRRIADQLAGVGLADLCLDLADAGPVDTAVARRELLDRIATSITGWTHTPSPGDDPHQARTRELVDTLVRHDRALHRVREPWGVSAHELIGELLELERSARSIPGSELEPVRLPRRVVAALDHRELDRVGSDLAAWVRARGPELSAGIGPWAGSLGSVTEHDQVDSIVELLGRLGDHELPEARRRVFEVGAGLGLPTAGSLGAAAEQLALAEDLVEILGRYHAPVFDPSVELDLGVVEPSPDGRTGRVAGRARRRLRTLLAGHRIDGSTPSRRETIDDAHRIHRIRRRWSETGRPPPDPDEVPPIGEARAAVTRVVDTVGQLAHHVPSLRSAHPGATFDDLDGLRDLVAGLSADRSMLVALPELARLHRRLTARELTPLLEQLASRPVGPDGADDAVAAVRRSWARSVVDELMLIDDALGSADADHLDAAAGELGELDGRRRARRPLHVRASVAARATAATAMADDVAPALRAAAGRVSPPPLHETLAGRLGSVTAALPIWLTSPHVVAELVPGPRPPTELGDAPNADTDTDTDTDTDIDIDTGTERDGDIGSSRFDVVVVLGAERLSAAAAAPAVHRARRVVAFVGGRSVADGSLAGHLCERVPPDRRRRFRWYHRVGDGRLGAVAELLSGREVGEVLAVPSPSAVHPLRLLPAVGRPGEHPVSVPPAEVVRRAEPRAADPRVEAVVTVLVDLVVEHAVGHPTWSLAVVVPDEEWVERLEDAVRAARRSHDPLDGWLDAPEAPRLLVRSSLGLAGHVCDHVVFVIERRGAIDGDEHVATVATDTVVVPDAAASAVSTARHLVTVVPMDADREPDPTEPGHEPVDASSRLCALAGSGADPVSTRPGPGSRGDAVLSDVAEGLRARGVPVDHVPGRVPELALRHPDDPGRWVLAVVGDGPIHDGLVSVVDREVLFVAHLTQLGWRWHRVRTVPWFRSRSDELDRLIEVWRQVC